MWTISLKYDRNTAIIIQALHKPPFPNQHLEIGHCNQVQICKQTKQVASPAAWQGLGNYPCLHGQKLTTAWNVELSSSCRTKWHKNMHSTFAQSKRTKSWLLDLGEMQQLLFSGSISSNLKQILDLLALEGFEEWTENSRDKHKTSTRAIRSSCWTQEQLEKIWKTVLQMKQTRNLMSGGKKYEENNLLRNNDLKPAFSPFTSPNICMHDISAMQSQRASKWRPSKSPNVQKALYVSKNRMIWSLHRCTNT